MSLTSSRHATRPSGDADLIARLRAVERAPRALQIRTMQVGRITLLRVSGPIDVVTTPVLGEAIQPRRGPGQRLVLDLRAVDYIESPGLRLLLALGDDLQVDGGQLRLILRAGSRVERTLRLASLHQRFPVFHTAPEALAGRPLTAEDLADSAA